MNLADERRQTDVLIAEYRDQLAEAKRRIVELEQLSVFTTKFGDKLRELGTDERFIESYRESKMKARELEQQLAAANQRIATLEDLIKSSHARIDRIGEYLIANELELIEPADFVISAIKLIARLRTENAGLRENSIRDAARRARPL